MLRAGLSSPLPWGVPWRTLEAAADPSAVWWAAERFSEKRLFSERTSRVWMTWPVLSIVDGGGNAGRLFKESGCKAGAGLANQSGIGATSTNTLIAPFVSVRVRIMS